MIARPPARDPQRASHSGRGSDSPISLEAMRCSTCHRDQAEALFQRGKRQLKTCAPCREERAVRRTRDARAPAAPKIALDIPAPGVPFRARLYHADALDLLGSIERPDLIVTAPPYGIGHPPERQGRIPGDEDMKVGYAVLALAIRKLRPGGQAYVFGDARRPFLRRGLDRALRPLVEVLQPLAWNPREPLGLGGRSRPWGHAWEYITIWERLPDDREAVWNALRRMHEESRDPQPTAVERGSTPGSPRPVLLASHARGGRDATSKPVTLLKQIIAVSSRIGDLVLDPFAGSGATAVAALELGRRFLGVESDERRAHAAGERIASARWPSVDEALVEEAHWGEGLGDWWEQIEPA